MVNVFDIDLPAFLMNAPFSLSADVPNNIWMEELDSSERLVQCHKAVAQFFELYRTISQFSIVYLLPSTPGLQDQTYVSNLGVVLPHLSECTVVLSRFRTAPRIEEPAIGRTFFEMMNFRIMSPPEHLTSSALNESDDTGAGYEENTEIFFEGEADLKYLVDNVYIGAHGLRSSRSAHRWLSDSFDMKIIPFHIKYERLYHLDCCVMPISPQKTAVCTAAADKSSIEQIEKHVEILDITMDAATYGATNCLVAQDELLYSSNIHELPKLHRRYEGEKAKVVEIEKLSSVLGLEARMFNLSEFDKSGADLSCLIMNLNYKEYLNGSTNAAQHSAP